MNLVDCTRVGRPELVGVDFGKTSWIVAVVDGTEEVHVGRRSIDPEGTPQEEVSGVDKSKSCRFQQPRKCGLAVVPRIPVLQPSRAGTTRRWGLY